MMALRFDERWISDEQLHALAGLAIGTDGLPGEVIEIGTWQGLSAIPLAAAVYPAELHVVDHWLGDPPGQGIAPGLAARDNYGIFLANISEGTRGNVTVWKMGWRQFAAQWDKPIRFLHLDATHTTREVSDTIAAFRPLIVPGGIFAGDDWGWPPLEAGVREQFRDEAVSTRFGTLWWVRL
jgi:hypothetical protein